MKIKVIFENRHSAAYWIDKEFQHLNKNIFDVEKVILEDFSAAFKNMSPLYPDIFRFDSIHILFMDYQSESRSNTLAYFNTEKSIRSNAYVFAIYYNTCREYLMGKWASDNQTGMSEDGNDLYTGVWDHEIIHMLDFNTIKDFHEDRDNFIEKEFSRNEGPIGFYLPDKPKDYWLLLDLIFLMRIEGASTLFECLRGHRSDSLGNYESFMAHLNSQINAIIGLIESRDNISHKNQLINDKTYQALRSLCYETGKWILVDILSRDAEFDHASLCRNLLKNGTFAANSDQTHAIMKSALRIDFSEFLLAFLSISSPEHQLLNSFSIISKIGHFSSGRISNDTGSDLLNLYLHSRSLNEEAYISILQKHMGARMSAQEIEDGISRLQSTNTNNTAPKEVHISNKTIDLYNLWKEDRSDKLLAYTLTYILDQEDMIPDNIDFLGHIDDLAILDGTYHLVRKRKNNIKYR